MSKKKQNDPAPAAPNGADAAGKKPEEKPGLTTLITPPSEGFMRIADLPDARKHWKVNIRTVKVREGETPNQAIDRDLNIPAHMADIERSTPGLMRQILIGEWDTVPEWLAKLSDEGKAGYEAFTKPDGSQVIRAIVDGNRTAMALRGLLAKYPDGHVIDIKDHDPVSGEVKVVKVEKKYDQVPVQIFRNLRPDAFRQLQAVSNNKLPFKRGDVAKPALELIQADPIGVTAKDVEALLGDVNRKVITKAEKFHSQMQEFERAALSPKDVTLQYIDYLNDDVDEKGVKVAHPSNQDLRDIFPFWKAEFISYDGGKVSYGPLYDPEIDPRNMTSDEVAAVWATGPKGALTYTEVDLGGNKGKKVTAVWKPCAKQVDQETQTVLHDPEACTCTTPDLQSKFLAKWRAIKTAPRQGKRGSAKLDALKLAAAQGVLAGNGAPISGAFVGSISQGAGEVPFEKMQDFQKRFEQAGLAALKKYEPEQFKALMTEFKALKAAATVASAPAPTGTAA